MIIKKGKTVILNGMFEDQKGAALIGKITGYNGKGIPCRLYTWLEPKDHTLLNKQFEAFDTQIQSRLSYEEYQESK